MITKELLKTIVAMMPIASDDPTRYHIQCVLIESTADGVTLTATNGHMLVTRDFKSGCCPHGTYSVYREDLAVLKHIVKECRHMSEIDAAVIDGGLLVGTFVKMTFKKHTYYPPYRQVIPTHAEGVTRRIAFNAEYLLAICEALAREGYGKAPNVTLEFDPEQPLKAIKVTRNNSGLGILMPCRL